MMASKGVLKDDAKEQNHESSKLAEPALRQLVPDGDIMLLVGPKREKIQISSHLLCMTSPFFRVMLESDFKEGEAFRERKDDPAEIELPEDSPHTVWNAFRVLYGASPTTKYFSPKEMKEIGFMADKYQMTERFSFAGAFWLRARDPPDVEATWILMTVGYLLRSSRGLFHFSRLLVTKKGVSLAKYAFEMPDRMLGLKLCLAIEELRSRGKIHLGICLDCFDQVEQTGLGFVMKAPGCSFDWHVSK